MAFGKQQTISLKLELRTSVIGHQTPALSSSKGQASNTCPELVEWSNIKQKTPNEQPHKHHKTIHPHNKGKKRHYGFRSGSDLWR
jgi:hypothetical protein